MQIVFFSDFDKNVIHTHFLRVGLGASINYNDKILRIFYPVPFRWQFVAYYVASIVEFEYLDPSSLLIYIAYGCLSYEK